MDGFKFEIKEIQPISINVKYEPPLKVDGFFYELSNITFLANPSDGLDGLLSKCPNRKLYLNDKNITLNHYVSNYKDGTTFIAK